MKKIILMTAIALIGLASCTKTYVEPEPELKDSTSTPKVKPFEKDSTVVNNGDF